MDYQSLVQISIEIDIILFSDLSQLERQSLIEIQQDVAEKLERISEMHRDQQLENEMEARAYYVEQEEEAEEEEEEQEDVYGEEREE